MKQSTIDRENPIPIYRQISEIIKNDIKDGQDTFLLPSEHELAQKYGVSRDTARQAITTLVNLQLAYRIHGKGTFTGKQPEILHDLASGAEQRYNTIGIVIFYVGESTISKLHSPFHYTVLSGIDSIVNRDFSLKIITKTGFDKLAPFMSRESLKVDGLIFVFPRKKHLGLIKSAINNLCPYIVIYKTGEEEVNYVQADNYGGAYSLTEHLLEYGRRKIAFVGPISRGGGVQRQFQGYRAALKKHGVRWYSWMLIEQENYENALSEILARGTVDTIMAANDILAVNIIKGLKRRGLVVPDEIAITGFSNIDAAIQADPPLTTVHLPLFDIGAEAGRAMVRLIENNNQEQIHIELKTELIVRASSGSKLIN